MKSPLHKSYSKALRARGGSRVTSACLANIKVCFIAEQQLFTNKAIAQCQKVIELKVSRLATLVETWSIFFCFLTLCTKIVLYKI